jgi:hypothetical protein
MWFINQVYISEDSFSFNTATIVGDGFIVVAGCSSASIVVVMGKSISIPTIGSSQESLIVVKAFTQIQPVQAMTEDPTIVVKGITK